MTLLASDLPLVADECFAAFGVTLDLNGKMTLVRLLDKGISKYCPPEGMIFDGPVVIRLTRVCR